MTVVPETVLPTSAAAESAAVAVEPQTPEETNFLTELTARKMVIFDWNTDHLWIVKDGDQTNRDPENYLNLSTARYRELMTGEQVATTSDTIVSLLRQGVDVDIQNAPFPTQEELDQYMAELRAAVENS